MGTWFFHLQTEHSIELEVLGPLDGNLVLPLADRALHPEHQLLRGLRLLPQDRLRLASKALLLAVIPPSALSLLTLSRLLVLRHLELSVFVALGTVGVPGFWDIHHLYLSCRSESSNKSL